MKVRLIRSENAAGLRDPMTRRSPFIDPATGALLETADVADTAHWHRRVRDGDIAIIEFEPTGNEPIAPLTTRTGRK